MKRHSFISLTRFFSCSLFGQAILVYSGVIFKRVRVVKRHSNEYVIAKFGVHRIENGP